MVYEYKVGSTLDNQYNSPCSHNKGEENHMINSINAESVIDKEQYPITSRTLSTLGIEGNYLNLERESLKDKTYCKYCI